MIEQGTDAWLAERAGHVTGSRAADMMAETKTKGYEASARRDYRVELAIERITGRPVVRNLDFIEDVRRGKRLEPVARALYSELTETLPAQLGFTRHPKIEWVGCSPDAEVESGVGGLEIKAPRAATHVKYMLDGPPPNYKLQMDFEMWVMGWQWVDFVSINTDMPDEMKLYIQRWSRDDKRIALLEGKTLELLTDVEKTLFQLRNIKPRR